MKDGKIVKSGGVELVKYIEENGYEKIEKNQFSSKTSKNTRN